MRCTCLALPETLALTAGEKGSLLGGSWPWREWEGVRGLGGAIKKTRGDALAGHSAYTLVPRGALGEPRHTPQGREEAAGLALGLASGGWSWTGPRRPPDRTRAEPSSVFRAEAGLGRLRGGRSGKVTLARGGAGAA